MIDIAFVFFRTLDLRHLDAALYSLSRQDFTEVGSVFILDNNTTFTPDQIEAVVQRYPVPVPVEVGYGKHGDPNKTQSWSVNAVMRRCQSPWVFFTRADYILDASTLARFAAVRDQHPPDWRGFVTSYAYHMAFDERGDQRIEGFRDIEQHDWRTRGAQVLLTDVNGWRVDSSHLDAGVWLTRRALWAEVGGLDERLHAWGYQQTVFQRALREHGVDIVQIPEFLFFHQHHAAPRSYDVAKAQLAETGLTVEALQAFRPDVGAHKGNVCDELD